MGRTIPSWHTVIEQEIAVMSRFKPTSFGIDANLRREVQTIIFGADAAFLRQGISKIFGIDTNLILAGANAKLYGRLFFDVREGSLEVDLRGGNLVVDKRRGGITFDRE